MKIYNNTDGSTGYNYSSKGNQLKFQIDDFWYKGDFLGYEGAAEIVTSELLKNSNVKNFVKYSYKEIEYNNQKINGCVSTNFLKQNESLITAERLYKSLTNNSLSEDLAKMPLENKIKYFVNEMSNITNLPYVGEYLTTLLELDTIILNEDRHFHNIAFIKDENGKYNYAPIFDNGASFLSDIRNEYPLEKNVYGLINDVKSKPFSTSFDKQMEICEKLYGKQLEFSKNIDLKNVFTDIENAYGSIIKERINCVYDNRKFMYQEFFTDVRNLPKWEKNFIKQEYNKILDDNGCIRFISNEELQKKILSGDEVKLYSSNIIPQLEKEHTEFER